METVAHHQPAPVAVHLTTMSGDIGDDLGLQRRRQHLPGAVADDLIQHRRAGPVGLRTFLDYFEHEGVPSRTSASTPVLIENQRLQIILGKVRPFTSPSRGPSTGSDHCSLRQTQAQRMPATVLRMRRAR